MVLVASGVVGCSPAEPRADTAVAASPGSATQAAPAAAANSGCRTRPRVAGTGRTTTPVRICAYPWAHLESGSTAGKDGIIVASLTNTGQVADDRWQLAPGVTYYLRVFPKRAGKAENGFYQISSFTDDSWDEVPTERKGSFIACAGTGHPKQPRAHAGFSTCTQGKPTDAEDPAVVTGVQGSGGPAWITCKEGCCTTDIS